MIIVYKYHGQSLFQNGQLSRRHLTVYNLDKISTHTDGEQSDVKSGETTREEVESWFYHQMVTLINSMGRELVNDLSFTNSH